jgi:hypothetical protein
MKKKVAASSWHSLAQTFKKANEERVENFLKKHPLWKTDPVLKDALERAEKILAEEKK